MILKNNLMISSAALIALVATTSNAWAGDAAELDEVVVSATRTSTGLADAPAAVTVITSRQIENKNVSRLGDALTNVPSLFLRAGALGESQGTQGTSGMSLRGVDHRKVLVLIDGQPIQDAGSGQINWRTAFVDDIARVEVVPGAFSSLYGSNAIGGVINVITKQPDRREFLLKAKNGWGDAKGRDASLYFRDKSENGLGVVAGAGYQNRDSYINEFVVKAPVATAGGTVPVTGAQPTTDSSGNPAYIVGDKGAAPWRQINATTRLYYDLSAVEKVFAGVSYSRTNLGYSPFNSYLSNAAGTSVISGNNLLVNGQHLATLSEANFVNNSPLLESNTRYFAGYNGVFGTDKLVEINVARIDRQYRFENASTTATWLSGTGTQSDSPNNGSDASMQLTLPIGTAQTLVSGVALHKETVDSKTYNLSNWRDPATRTSASSGYTGDSTTSSLFVQDELGASQQLKVYVGGRYDSWRTQGSYFTTPATAISYATRSASSFSGKLSAVYHVDERITLRTSYGQSFRAPTNNDLYAYSNIAGITSIGDPNLKPEKGDSWEIGVNWQVADGVKTGATYYQTSIRDLLTNYRIQTVPSIISQRINAGKAKISGVELSGDAELNSWLNMSASYAYIKSEMLENAIDPLSIGKRLIDSPKNIINLGFTAKHDAWIATLNASQYGKVYSTAQNTDVAQGVPGAYDPRTLVNSKIAYSFSKEIKGYVAINNLLNEKSYSFFLNPGRSLMAGVDLVQ